MINLVLKEFHEVSKSPTYILLKNTSDNRLRNKERQAKILTSFRQNNEVNIQTLKKGIKYILDSYSAECLQCKPLAADLQEIIKVHLS